MMGFYSYAFGSKKSDCQCCFIPKCLWNELYIIPDRGKTTVMIFDIRNILSMLQQHCCFYRSMFME